MPYIPVERAQQLAQQHNLSDEALRPGDIAWAVSEDIAAYLERNGVSFETLNAMVGVLDNVKNELQSRLINYYERNKRNNGGDDPFAEIIGELF